MMASCSEAARVDTLSPFLLWLVLSCQKVQRDLAPRRHMAAPGLVRSGKWPCLTAEPVPWGGTVLSTASLQPWKAEMALASGLLGPAPSHPVGFSGE